MDSLPSNAATPKFPEQVGHLSHASVISKRTIILTKRPPVDTTVLSGTERRYWLIGIPEIPGIPSDLRSRPEQSHYLNGALLVGDNTKSVESPICVPTFSYTEKSLTFTIYDYILKLRPIDLCYLFNS